MALVSHCVCALFMGHYSVLSDKRLMYITRKQFEIVRFSNQSHVRMVAHASVCMCLTCRQCFDWSLSAKLSSLFYSPFASQSEFYSSAFSSCSRLNKSNRNKRPFERFNQTFIVASSTGLCLHTQYACISVLHIYRPKLSIIHSFKKILSSLPTEFDGYQSQCGLLMNPHNTKRS